MRKRAIRCAALIVIVVGVLTASAIPVAAQNYYANLIEAYERSMRPLRYMRGKLNPYVHQKADFFGGIDAGKATTFAWAGASWAPFGTLAEDGWSMRFMGGAGLYSYATSVVPGGINDANVFSGEVLGGYRKTFNNILGTRIYAGAFVGLFHESQLLLSQDPFHPAQGTETGIKGSLELFARVREHYLITAFATAASVHQKYHAKTTLLRELSDRWALGGEFATMGDARYSENRVGLTGSLTLDKRIFTLSGGVLENSGRGSGSYVTFSVYSPL